MQNLADSRAIARFDFVLTWYAKDAGKAWLSSLTTWGWKQGVGLVYALAPGDPDNVESANRVLEAGEAAGVLRRGNVDMDHSLRMAAGTRYGGATAGRGRRPSKLVNPHPSDHAWQLTELGEAFFRYLQERT